MEKQAQSIINDATTEQNRREELFNLFYPKTLQQTTDENITKILGSQWN